jgi:sulfur-oxidizing protein SoxA
MPIAPPEDPRLRSFREQGAAIWARRQGQLNLSCAICHDDNAGKKLAGVAIPEAHPTGYPIYRLEWQALGSLKRRLRNCLVGVRAEAYPYDALEYVALEVFLMDRAKGMILESPGVRP